MKYISQKIRNQLKIKISSQRFEIVYNSTHNKPAIYAYIFIGLETREVDTSATDRQRIHLIVPVSGRRETLRRFLANYERVCLSQQERTELLVVLFPSDDSPEDDADLAKSIERLQRDYGDDKLRLVQGRGKFSRARALDQGSMVLQDDDLMFFVDVDISFESAALQRIRRNTIRGERIYFPVVFSQYDPHVVYDSSPGVVASSVVAESTGFWRQFGFGIVALFKRDYDAIGRFDLTIEGWGKEDVDLFEKAVRSNLRIFRAPDLDLVHVYHGVTCDKSLKGHQFAMCKGTRADTYAGTEQLASLVYRSPEYLDFAKAKRLQGNGSSPAVAA